MGRGFMLQIDDSDLKRLASKMQACPEVTRKAVAVTLGQKRAVSRVITFVSEEAQVEYNVKRKDIKSIAKTKIKRGGTYTSTQIIFQDTALKANRFPNVISRSRNRSPVTLKIKKTPVISGANPIMFGSRTNKEIYKRNPSERQIKPVYTLSIPQMISNDEVYKRIQDKTQKYIMERLEHELDYRLGLLAKK